MRLNHFRFTFLALGLYIVCKPAFAEYSCQFDFRMGLIVSSGHVRIIDETKTLYQINQHTQAFSSGRFIVLNEEQENLVKAYSSGIEELVPEITLLAKEGIGVVVDNIVRVYSGLVGHTSGGIEELQASMKKAKKTVSEVYGFNGDYYYITPAKLEVESVDIESLQQQITSGFSNVSGILTAIGTVDVSKQTERAENEFMLQKRAKSACQRLEYLDSIEKEIQKSVTSLKKLDVIVSVNAK